MIFKCNQTDSNYDKRVKKKGKVIVKNPTLKMKKLQKGEKLSEMSVYLIDYDSTFYHSLCHMQLMLLHQLNQIFHGIDLI